MAGPQVVISGVDLADEHTVRPSLVRNRYARSVSANRVGCPRGALEVARIAIPALAENWTRVTAAVSTEPGEIAGVHPLAGQGIGVGTASARKAWILPNGQFRRQKHTNDRGLVCRASGLFLVFWKHPQRSNAVRALLCRWQMLSGSDETRYEKVRLDCLRQPAAVDFDVLTGDVCGVLLKEEENGLEHIFEGGGTASREALGVLL